MYELLNIYRENTGKQSLFSELITIDFYDSPTEALCKIILTNEWILASLVYFDLEKGERVFSIIGVPNDWLNKFRAEIDAFKKNNFDYYNGMKKEIKNYFANYSGNTYLFKARSLSSIDYKIVQIENASLIYYDNIEKVIRQDKKEKKVWKNIL